MLECVWESQGKLNEKYLEMKIKYKKNEKKVQCSLKTHFFKKLINVSCMLLLGFLSNSNTCLLSVFAVDLDIFITWLRGMLIFSALGFIP